MNQMTGDPIHKSFKTREEKRAASRDVVMKMIYDRSGDKQYNPSLKKGELQNG